MSGGRVDWAKFAHFVYFLRRPLCLEVGEKSVGQVSSPVCIRDDRWWNPTFDGSISFLKEGTATGPRQRLFSGIAFGPARIEGGGGHEARPVDKTQERPLEVFSLQTDRFCFLRRLQPQ